jgi:hypothetical protein
MEQKIPWWGIQRMKETQVFFHVSWPVARGLCGGYVDSPSGSRVMLGSWTLRVNSTVSLGGGWDVWQVLT